MLNLGPIINQGNPGGRGGLWPWKSGWGEGSRGTGNPGGRGGQKLLPSQVDHEMGENLRPIDTSQHQLFYNKLSIATGNRWQLIKGHTDLLH